MRTLSNIALLAGFVLCGCSTSIQPGTTHDLRLEAASTAAGDSIVLTLANRTGQNIGYNLCASAIEQREDGEWRPVAVNRACTMELRTLQSGSDVTYRTTLPPGSSMGAYRFRTNVQMLEDGGNRMVDSNVVTVPIGQRRQ